MTQAIAIDRPGYLLRGARDEYDRVTAVNYSTIKELNRSPRHYQHRLAHPTVATPAMVMGSALHLAVLEPDLFALRYAAFDGDRRTKAGKEEWAAFLAEGKSGLKADDYQRCLNIADAVNSDEHAARFLADLMVEVGIVWTDAETGLLCKGRVDGINAAGIIDLKTTADASPRVFCSDAWSRCYHWQGAMYVDGYERATGELVPYTMIAVESQAPHIVQVYTVPPEVLDIGREEYGAALLRLRGCRSHDRWPGYVDGVAEFVPPRWAGIAEEDTDIIESGLEF
jgi:hypothetical protein